MTKDGMDMCILPYKKPYNSFGIPFSIDTETGHLWEWNCLTIREWHSFNVNYNFNFSVSTEHTDLTP